MPLLYKLLLGFLLVILMTATLGGYAVYSVSFGAAGALISRIEDAQTAAFPMSMMALVGFIVSFQVLDNPDGPLADRVIRAIHGGLRRADPCGLPGHPGMAIRSRDRLVRGCDHRSRAVRRTGVCGRLAALRRSAQAA